MPESEDRPEGRPERPGRRLPRERQSSPEAAARIKQQHTWVDLQVQEAIRRGEFDNLPGAGKPLADLGTEHDPDWWIKKLVERERVVVLPLSVQLRREDAELEAELDRLAMERDVRARVEDFNARVIAARYRLPEGPPLITMPRDVEETVTAWRERRDARLEELRHRAAAREAERPRRWWQRRRRG